MLLTDFDYLLPEELIAHKPKTHRSSSRLLVTNRHKESIQHACFSDILSHIPKNACLVFNDTKVINARLFGKTKNNVSIECFLVKQLDDTTWHVLLKPAKRVKNGNYITESKMQRNGYG